MSRHRRFLFLTPTIAMLVLVALGISVVWMATPQPTVTLDNFQRIKLGMSVNEVNDILGRQGIQGPCGHGECSWSWTQGGNTVEISVGQDDGMVTYADFISSDRTQYWLERKSK